MAKKPKISPSGEFIRNSADIIRQLGFSMFTPLARLCGVDAFEAARDKISDLLNIPTSAYTRNDFRPILTEVGNTLKAATSNKEFVTRFKKDKNGYTFTLYKKETQGGMVSFGTAVKLFPGSGFPRFRNDISSSDKLSIIWAMMSAAGFNFTPSGEKFEAYYTPMVVKDQKTRRKAADQDEVEMATDDTSGIAGLVDLANTYANHTHNQTTMNGAFTSTLRYEVEVLTLGQNVSVNISPRIDLSISENLVDYMAETEDKSATDYLVFAWMNDAIERSARGGRSSTKNLPAVDLRLTSKKLRAVADRFQSAKPRLNQYGFCINRQGLPMYIPDSQKADNTQQFMTDHSNFSVDEDGYLNYEAVANDWASKIVMVDWFNDVIVYTSVTGKLAVYRMLGYIPLDTTSEYIWLNTGVNNRRVKVPMQELEKLVDVLVTRDEAQAELAPEYSRADAYNAGKISQDFKTLFFNFRARAMSGNGRFEPSDPNYRHENLMNPLIKHMFGLEVEELPELQRGQAMHIAAYLRAASKKRREVTLDIMKRLSGIEYFLVMPQKFSNPSAWAGIRGDATAEMNRRKGGQPLLNDIDIPNLDAGGNLKGFMPHQVRVLSDRASGSNTNITGVAPGGGKSLLQLGDILMELDKNPDWRPILVTKPRLVKGIVSEFNFFSKGKVNVVSLRMSQLRYIQQTLRLNNALDLINWVKSFPKNTVFVCGYTDFSSSTKLFGDLDVPSRVMLQDVELPQFLHLLRIIGFDTVKLDESHIIKNMASRRARNTYSLLAQAQSKMELSGTIVSNTAVDLVGQAYGINPMIFGNNTDDFKDTYQLSGGLIRNDEQSFAINERLRKFTQMTSATKEDWSFVLPDLYDEILTPMMTPKQAKFYDLLMNKAYLDLKSKLDSNTSGNEDEDEGDEGDEGDEEDVDTRFQMQADASLAEAEQFLVSPDTNQQFLVWSENPSGDDLVSPMVRAIDAQLAKIYQNRAEDHSNNKSAVFGIHKVASGHFMRHTKFKDICLHYRAGDEDVIRRFKTDPDKWILVADSTSIREGENLQMLSYIFDMQATWAPGDFEQLISRMYRPDPKGQYNKDLVTHFWITPQHMKEGRPAPTIATVKLARMISKSVSIARFKYDGDGRWSQLSKEFEDLDLLKMNLKLIFETDERDLAPYYQAWGKLIGWERGINQKTRKAIAEKLEEDNPGIKLIDPQGRVIDRNLFTRMVMREAKSTRMLPGSRRVFTPWEPGSVPADLHDMSLAILGSDNIERGAYVWTEYGPGIVMQTGTNQLWVELYGRKKAKIYRNRIAVPNGEGVKKLNAIVTSPSAWATETWVDVTKPFGTVDVDASMAPKGKKIAPTGTGAAPAVPATKPLPQKININDFIKKPKPTQPDLQDEEEVENDEKLDIEDIYVYIINGMPALAITDAPSGVENFGWLKVAPFRAMSFATWAAAETFLQAMSTKFAISSTKMAQLEEEMDEFKDGRAMRLTRRVTNAQTRNFFQSNHRKLSTASDGRDRVDPYWVAIGSQIYLAFSNQSHSTKVMNWLNLIASKNPSKIKKPKNVGAMHMNVFSTLNEAYQDLKNLAQNFNIPLDDVRTELRNIKDEIMALKQKKTRPTNGRR